MPEVGEQSGEGPNNRREAESLPARLRWKPPRFLENAVWLPAFDRMTFNRMTVDRRLGSSRTLTRRSQSGYGRSEMSTRERLRERLAVELDDEQLADRVTDALTDSLVADIDRLVGGNLETSPHLSYRADVVAPNDVTVVFAFAYGYRFAPGVDAPEDGSILPQSSLVPGPVNEELARLIAAFVADHPVPIVAQWEIALVLETLGVACLISVEPDTANDGSVIYLSTVGVAEKGARMAAEASIDTATVAVFGHADHAVRCLAATRSVCAAAGVAEGVVLPTFYDSRSGQPWTRDRATWIPVDLFARTRTTP